MATEPVNVPLGPAIEPTKTPVGAGKSIRALLATTEAI